MAKQRDRLYEEHRKTARHAALRLWGRCGAMLSAAGIEVDDLTQHAELVLLELLPKVDPTNIGLENFIYKSIGGSLRDRFIRGELVRFSNQTPMDLTPNLAEPVLNPPKTLTESLFINMEGLDEIFCSLVLQGHKVGEARRLVGWNLVEYRAFKQRIGKKLGVKDGQDEETERGGTGSVGGKC